MRNAKGKFQFLPSAKTREFNSKKLIGRKVEVDFQHTDNDDNKKAKATSQYICLTKSIEPFGSVAGWSDIIRKKGTKQVWKIKNAYLMEHENGGRSDHNKYYSYKEFFNEQRKMLVIKRYLGGLMQLMFSSGGDPDEADLVVEFENGVTIDSSGGADAPQEWYSETFAGLERFKFTDGFYETAEEAIEYIKTRPTDDLFGTRYFPLMVLPISSSAKVVETIRWMPKASARPIVVGEQIVIGTRCKAHEFESVVQETYKRGGKVPKYRVWDW